MTVIPVVLERWILAGLLGFPALALLASVALEGEAGRLIAGAVVVAAVVYALIVSLALRRSLRRQAAAARPVPAEAIVEPLGRTALRAGGKAALGLVGAYVAGVVGLLPGAVVIALGFSLATAVGAFRLGRLEQAAGRRLVRVPGERGTLRRF